jgi:hypothetical protein
VRLLDCARRSMEHGSIINLNRFVPPGSGITLTDPSSINDRGEIVVDGTLNGNLHAFMLVPCEEDAGNNTDCVDSASSSGATQVGRPVRISSQLAHWRLPRWVR